MRKFPYWMTMSVYRNLKIVRSVILVYLGRTFAHMDK